MIEGFRIERLKQDSDLRPVANAYAEVFAGPPWNENTICQDGCSSFFGLETQVGQPCPDNSCKGVLSEAYPLDRTVRDMQMDIARPWSSSKALMRGAEVAGFAIGFPWTAVDFAKQKYNSDEMQKAVVDLLLSMRLREFKYISEIGVKEAFRGQGLSNALVEDLLKERGSLIEPRGVVLRTNYNSPMVAVCKKFGLTQIYGPEVQIFNGSGSKKLVVDQEPVNGLTDLDNPSRVLFAASRVELTYPPYSGGR